MADEDGGAGAAAVDAATGEPERAVYGPLLTEAYDLDKPEPTSRELSWYRAFVEAAEPPALELMCGSGRFLLPLLEAGLDVDGVDLSADMLDACRTHANRRGVQVGGRLHRQAVDALDLPRRYGAAFCPAASFGLLAGLDVVRAALRRIHDHLLPGGRLLLPAEPIPPPDQRSWVDERSWPDVHGGRIHMHMSATYDAHERIERGVGRYERRGAAGGVVQTEDDPWVRRFWAPGDLVLELERAGFVDVEVAEAAPGLLSATASRPPRA